MSRYEERQERRRERLAARAERKRQRAAASFGAVDEITDMIPLGQPILVGHHSECRHRRDLERRDDAMRRGVEATREAEELERRAEAVGRGGISSDDPDAAEKLRAELAVLEAECEERKRLNAIHRKGGWSAVIEAVGEGRATTLRRWSSYTGDGKPWPAYALRNLGANIRRIRGRIAELEARAARSDDGREIRGAYGGVPARLVEDLADSRVVLYLAGRVSREDYKRLRGWNRSPSRDTQSEFAFCRKITPAAWASGEALVERSDKAETRG